jgi:hypothetical protein
MKRGFLCQGDFKETLNSYNETVTYWDATQKSVSNNFRITPIKSRAVFSGTR